MGGGLLERGYVISDNYLGHSHVQKRKKKAEDLCIRERNNCHSYLIMHSQQIPFSLSRSSGAGDFKSFG